jgi:hypothetical protein
VNHAAQHKLPSKDRRPRAVDESTALIENGTLDIHARVQGFIDRFAQEVTSRIDRLV